MAYEYCNVFFIIASYIVSVLLWRIIYKHISKKSILSISLVDLIYRDTIIYVLFMAFCTYSAIIHTLMYSSFSLPYDLALIYSIAINIGLNAICISLIFSSGLRLISLAQNWEAAGEKPRSKVNQCLFLKLKF